MSKKYVKKFGLFGNEIFLKDSECRESVDIINSKIGGNDISSLADGTITGALLDINENVADVDSRIEEKYSVHYRRVITGNTYADVRSGVTVDSVEVGNHSGTTSDPYESLDYFFDRLNNGETDIRCYIRQSGVYVVTKPVVRNAIVHITVQADNVTIILNTDSLAEPFVMYTTHLNFRTDNGYTKCVLRTPNEKNQMYFENSTLTMDNVVYDGVLKQYGGYLALTNSKIGSIELLGCSGYLNDILITNQNPNTHGIWVRRGCNLIFSGSLADFNTLGISGNGNAMLKCEDCTLTLEYSQNVVSNYAYGIYADGSIIFVTSGRLASFQNNSNNGNAINNTILVQGNVTLP